ncbi:MAG: hypothetical protein ABJE10_15985 [bacterium]
MPGDAWPRDAMVYLAWNDVPIPAIADTIRAMLEGALGSSTRGNVHGLSDATAEERVSTLAVTV